MGGTRDETVIGKVYLVGAGPGAAGLITVNGMQALEKAQVVVYDRLVDPALLRSVPSDAELIFVGKARGHQELTQPEINRLLVDKAGQGNTVVRLKGGDPFVFGRGGEEARRQPRRRTRRLARRRRRAGRARRRIGSVGVSSALGR